jgi:hypothetical protein
MHRFVKLAPLYSAEQFCDLVRQPQPLNVSSRSSRFDTMRARSLLMMPVNSN